MICRRCNEIMESVGFMHDSVLMQCFECGRIITVEQDEFLDELMAESESYEKNGDGHYSDHYNDLS